MANYTAGSVSAKITLDTKDFQEEIKKLKDSLKTLKQDFKKVTLQSVAKDVEKLKKQMKGLKKDSNNASKEIIKGLHDTTKSVQEVDRATQQFRKNFDKLTPISFDKNGNLIEGFKKAKTVITEANSEVERTKRVYSEAGKEIKAVNDELKKNGQRRRYGKPAPAPDPSIGIPAGVMLDKDVWEQLGFEIGQKALKLFLKEFAEAPIVVKRSAEEIENALLQFADFRYFENANRELRAYLRTWSEAAIVVERSNSEIASAIAKYTNVGRNLSKADEFKMALRGLAAYRKELMATQNVYSKWSEARIKHMSTSARENETYEKTFNSFRKQQQVLKYITSGYNQLTKSIIRTTQVLKTFNFKLLEGVDKESIFYKRTMELSSAMWKLNSGVGTRGSKTQYQGRQVVGGYSNYISQSSQIAESLKKTNDELSKSDINARKAGRGITSFNNGVVQTAHSGRILSNTLYQIRGALLSLKMIFTAMGGMALWGFATDIAEGVKETFKAKNEMDAQLNQMFTNKKGYTDTSSIEYFNKALNKLPETFKKVNKYQVGETVSSIGLEFDLTAKQMKEALPIVTMITSEYVRAGRKESEAALAVKDILQGEFQRLSRETGVGKEELVAYGWDEDKTNIDGLLKALKKAALDRHWDLFAKKATSLNDILTITKSRFSEAGADIMQSATPVIVEAFNMIIGAIDSLQNAFNGLGSFGKNFTLFGGLTGGVLALGTALPMIIKNMGLAEVATLGWSKSLLTATLNLDKVEVGQYGLRKAIAAVITGTKASELTTISSTKAILGRFLGVKQATLAEHGFLSALVESKATLKGHSQVAISAAAGMGNLRQKIIYLAKGEIVADKASATWGKTLKSLITSTKLLRLAIMGIIGIGLISWLAGVAVWTDTVAKRVEKYNTFLQEGKDKVKDATKVYDKYNKKLEGMSKGDKGYSKTKSLAEQAKNNKTDIELAYKLSKEIRKKDKKDAEEFDLSYGKILNKAYKDNGVSDVDKFGANYQIMKQAKYDIAKSEKEREKFEYASLQHINEHVAKLKEAKVSEEDRTKYITEYSAKAKEAGENLKKFNQGDFQAGAMYLLNRVQLAWIDLWNDTHFVNFWKSVNATWKDLKPTVDWLVARLGDLGHILLDFFSTQQGQIVGGIGLVSLAIVGLSWKLKGIIGPIKDAVGGLKDLTKWFKKAGVAGKDSDTDSKDKGKGKGKDKSTGGITGDIEKPTSNGKFWETVGNDAKNTGRNMFKYMGYIAAATVLATEAILLLNAPMLALAGTGEVFKRVEPQVRKGIDGLKLIAPVVIALLVPMIGLMYVLDHFKVDAAKITTGFKNAATGIALGLVLVTEAIVLLNAPLIGLGVLGAVYGGIKQNAEQGVEAMKLTHEALMALIPWIPVFAAGIALAALATTGVGVVGIVVAAGGIAIGIGLVTEAIALLFLPLEAIKELGAKYKPDLPSIQAGVEAIKATADSMTYLEQGISAFAKVKWEVLAAGIADIVANWVNVDLNSLTSEGGFFEELQGFINDFSKVDLTLPDGFADQVANLKTAGDGMNTIGDAMKSVQDAINNIPPEFKGKAGDQLGLTGNNADGTRSQTQSVDVQGYFDTFKEPLRQLKTFVDDFNKSDEFDIQEINPDRVANLSKTADMIVTVQDAVEKVKTTMQGIGQSGHETAFATGGALMAFGYDLFHMTGEGAVNNGASSGNYKSSLGSQLQEMENVVSDLFTFQTNIGKYGGSGEGEGTDVSGIANMVTVIQEAISNVSTALSNAVPTFEGKGNALSSAVVRGFNANLKFGNIPAKIANSIMTNKETLYATASSLGKTTSERFKTGVDPMSTNMGNEMTDIKNELTGDKYTEIGNAAYALGQHASDEYNRGLDRHSPGRMARATSDEVGDIGNALNVNNLPQMAMNLGNALSNNFNVDFNLSNIQLPDMTQWTQKLNTVVPTVSNLKTQVSTNFEGMKTNVQNSFTNIVSRTRSSLASMKGATLKNIGGIKTSWKGMQDALIASAEHIKTQTGQKIDKLKSNLGDFWNKVKHPDQLLQGFQGGHRGSIRRRSVPKGNYAGPAFKPKRSRSQPSDHSMEEYLKCLFETGQPCYAGPWSFNWTKPISRKFKGWNTHFGQFHLDDYLNVGKFENSKFPVKGNAEVAKAYIFDVIRGTSYSKYFNSNFGDNPVAALLAGAFNCWDGTNVVLALASAFGFNGSRGHGTWNGIGHVWADIPGLGIIDPTAIQQNGSFTSSAVKGYHAGGTIRRGSKGDVPPNEKQGDHNEVHIHIEGDVYGIDDLNRKIEDGAKRVARILFRDSYSGV